MKKLKIIGITVGSLLVLAIIFYFVNSMHGNPVSKMLAKKETEKYLKENYPNQDLRIESVPYNFKFGRYEVNVVSDSSMDTHFAVNVSMRGKVYDDTYEEVENGWNTYCRLDKNYQELVDTVFKNPEFPIKSDIEFGEIKEVVEDDIGEGKFKYGIERSSLIKDKEYDIKEVAKIAGHIVFYAEDNDVSYKKAAELMLQIKEQLDKEDVPFYAIDFHLEKPREEDQEYDPSSPRIDVEDFFYSDIRKEGLEKAMEEVNRE